MIKQLDASSNTVAVTLTGKIRKEDVEHFDRLLAAALAQDLPVNLYAEIGAFDGVEWDAVDAGLDLGKRYIKSLKRFGRIAIVAGAAWMRAVSRLESMLLPHVSYEVFVPEQAQRALDWVRGKEERPRPSAFRMIESGDPQLIAFEIDGRVMDDEIKPLVDRIAAASEGRHPLRLLVRIKRLDGFDWRLLADSDYLRLKLRLLRSVDRYAIVGGPAWLNRMVNLLDPLLRMEIRSFDQGDEESAWRWLREQPAKERMMMDQRAS